MPEEREPTPRRQERDDDGERVFKIGLQPLPDPPELTEEPPPELTEDDES